VDCGLDDPIVLHFDHVRGMKVASVSYLVKRRSPLDVVIAEVEKCDVRCGNCHTRRHASDTGPQHRFARADLSTLYAVPF
jgi:hypothetical protein